MNRCVVWCCNGDEKAAGWFAHSAKSFRSHCKDIDMFLLTDHPWASESVEGITVIQIGEMVKRLGLDEILKHKWQGRQASPMMMGRLLIPFIDELKKYDRVLYLDIDTDIISDRMSEVFDIDISECDCGMALELFYNSSRSRQQVNMHPMARHCRIFLWSNGDITKHYSGNYDRLSNGVYYNSGVMIINNERMRDTFVSAENICSIAVRALRADLKLMDQDVINSVCNIQRINSAFNCFYCTHDDGDFVYCLHNAGAAKVSSKTYPIMKASDYK